MSKLLDNKKIRVLIIVLAGLLISWLLIFRLALPIMWNFLLVDETPKSSDAIIVLSGDTGRAEYGIELYMSGYAKNILFAGGASHSMMRQAIAAGIEEDRILLDRKSGSTYENARNCAAIMQAHELKSAIVVTSGYHTKRASIIFAQFFARSDLTICAAPPVPTQSDWWKDGSTVRAVISEYLKLTWHFLFER